MFVTLFTHKICMKFPILKRGFLGYLCDSRNFYFKKYQRSNDSITDCVNTGDLVQNKIGNV